MWVMEVIEVCVSVRVVEVGRVVDGEVEGEVEKEKRESEGWEREK